MDPQPDWRSTRTKQLTAEERELFKTLQIIIKSYITACNRVTSKGTRSSMIDMLNWTLPGGRTQDHTSYERMIYVLTHDVQDSMVRINAVSQHRLTPNLLEELSKNSLYI